MAYIYVFPYYLLPKNYKAVIPSTKNTIEVYVIFMGENNPIGYGVIDEKNNKYSLEHLYIDPEYRYQGYGQQLLKLINKDYKQLNLMVAKTNNIAIHIYKKLGFKIKSSYSKYYIMEK
uniref:Acetyltransferase (GNAT) family protein n=1 Tax=Pithovirus LCPAC302 TaxID=2506593 RepID=A0A481Z7E6_9VIRU|nr:MAG: acetyltransferase (GNAT) family protein [Pithovirus LCPAC302]